MYLRCNRRFKYGKEHCYWNIVEAKRCVDGRVVQRQVLYLGEINDSQHEAWCRVIEVFDEDTRRRMQLALFPAEREVPEHAKAYSVQVRLDAMQLHRPRQWGACWLACRLYEQLGLDHFWQARLPDSREGTRWRHILQTLVVYRLLDPGSEWRLHRLWFEQTAMADLLGADYALVEKNALYRCLDKLLPHKRALFHQLTGRWQDLFGVLFDILLYDLTSTYFESPPPQDEKDKRRFGYSRDKRRDCVQVVIALIVTPEGFPIAYEVLPGNTADKTTLKLFLQKIETQYGRAERIWVMDRGIPTEEVLEGMRTADPPVYYLVGTPRGRLTKLERALLPLPWQAVRAGVSVKLLPQDGELSVFAESRDRVHKERAMRQRQLKGLVKRLKQLQQMKFNDTRQFLLKLGEAKGRYRAAWRLIEVVLPKPAASETPPQPATSGATNELRKPNRFSPSGSIATSCDRCAAARGAIYCAPICVGGIRRICGSSTSNSLRSRRRSKTSRMICNCAPSTINSKAASKRISSSPSWPIACTSPCGHNSSRWHRVSPRVRYSTSSPASRCSMSTSRPPIAAP